MWMRSLLLITLLLTACLGFGQKTKPSAGKAAARKAAAGNATGGIDVEHSSITVHVLRGGVFGFTGDNHDISAPISKGKLDEAGGSIEFEIETANMKVLDPKMEPAKRAQVQEKMVGPEVLDVAHFPLIEFASTSVTPGAPGHWTVVGNLKLHGTLRSITLAVTEAPAEISTHPRVRHYEGTTKLKQTTFGMKPIAVAGGTVTVKDEMKIDFEIVTR
jgi:polyisoprenoid-binding protein YceI